MSLLKFGEVESSKIKVGIICREELVPALLFADDMVIFVEGEDELKRGLGLLDEWCREY